MLKLFTKVNILEKQLTNISILNLLKSAKKSSKTFENSDPASRNVPIKAINNAVLQFKSLGKHSPAYINNILYVAWHKCGRGSSSKHKQILK